MPPPSPPPSPPGTSDVAQADETAEPAANYPLVPIPDESTTVAEGAEHDFAHPHVVRHLSELGPIVPSTGGGALAVARDNSQLEAGELAPPHVPNAHAIRALVRSVGPADQQYGTMGLSRDCSSALETEPPEQTVSVLHITSADRTATEPEGVDSLRNVPLPGS